MTIKKLFVLVLVAVIVTFLLTSVAFAGGWHIIGPDHDPDAGKWAEKSDLDPTKVPHLNLSTSSNNCRTCHAVHNADNNGLALGDGTTGSGQAFKLLRNEDRKSECNFCHGENGALTNPVKKPYAPMMAGPTIVPAKGEHTLGAKVIPDSTVDPSSNSIASDGLSCGNCHSVHGGWTLNNVPSAGTLATKILRRDPANNGNDSDPNNDSSIGSGAAGGVINVQDQGNGNKAILGPDLINPLSEQEHLAAFCGDCHNKNVNWDRGGSGSGGDSTSLPWVSEGERPNKYAHPMGRVDGLIDVYGKLKNVEIMWFTGPLTCDTCHAGKAGNPNRFPHQTAGHKLFAITYTKTSSALESPDYRDPWDTSSDPSADDSYTGNPNRPLPNLDIMVCRSCHQFIGQANNPDSF